MNRNNMLASLLGTRLEKGERTDPETWTRIMTGFRGEFFLFLTWFN